jgi:ATP-dependent DNA helicase RecQ
MLLNGIDKANVKLLIHIQLPENLENYYRKGRSGEMEKKCGIINQSFGYYASRKPVYTYSSRQTFLNEMYVNSNYFQIAYGEGINEKIHL